MNKYSPECLSWGRARAAAKTVNYCNCQPAYNYTAGDGRSYNVTNGTCIRTTSSELPWCYVVEDTCITPVLHRPGLGRNDSGWDTCLNAGARAAPALEHLGLQGCDLGFLRCTPAVQGLRVDLCRLQGGLFGLLLLLPW